VEKQLPQLMARLFRIEENQITDALTMSDLEIWDSLKHMELVVVIEETFNIELSFDEIVEMKDVGAIKSILINKNTAVNLNGIGK